MNLTSEVELVQNAGLGALALWAFCNEYQQSQDEVAGPELQLSMFVLPMVFHEETLEAIRNRRYDGGLFLALAQHRDIGIELQERTEAMLPLTMAALNFAFASKLLTFRRQSGRLESMRKTEPYTLGAEPSRQMVSASKRLGFWFATINTPQICSLLNLQF